MTLGGKQITHKIIFIILLASMMLVSCSGAKETTIPPTATALPTPTPEPLKKLVVCLGEEPQSLYLYGSSSQATWSILEAIYDGPIDIENNTYEPVILEELPTQENGGVQLQSVSVTSGDKVANINGDVVALEPGVKVFPEGCTSSTCAVEWDGVSELKLVQMSASFTLLPGITWSDGQPDRMSFRT